MRSRRPAARASPSYRSLPNGSSLRSTVFKAIEVDAASRQRTGREHALDVQTRQEAIDELLRRLGMASSEARVDPTRTVVETAGHLWTIVATRAATPPEASGVRRAGAKHKRVR